MFTSLTDKKKFFLETYLLKKLIHDDRMVLWEFWEKPTGTVEWIYTLYTPKIASKSGSNIAHTKNS